MSDENRTEERRASHQVVGFVLPPWIADHAAAWFATGILGLITAGVLFFSDGRYWMRDEERAQQFQQQLERIDEKIKDKRAQIRTWTNYNTATPTSSLVPARNANIKATEDDVKDLIEAKQTRVKKWESEK